VLGGLGRARIVPIAFEGSILVLQHSMPTKSKIIIVHSLEVSKKEFIALATPRVEDLKMFVIS
jgi:hypothetical protein